MQHEVLKSRSNEEWESTDNRWEPGWEQETVDLVLMWYFGDNSWLSDWRYWEGWFNFMFSGNGGDEDKEQWDESRGGNHHKKLWLGELPARVNLQFPIQLVPLTIWRARPTIPGILNPIRQVILLTLYLQYCSHYYPASLSCARLYYHCTMHS